VERSGYTSERVRQFLCDYQRWAQGARPPKNEEQLGSRPPPLHEASWSRRAAVKADIERALRELPFADVQMAFMVLAMGYSSWRTGGTHAWRERVADWWGVEQGELVRTVDRVVKGVCAVLNGRREVVL